MKGKIRVMIFVTMVAISMFAMTVCAFATGSPRG